VPIQEEEEEEEESISLDIKYLNPPNTKQMF
jgi:hypothetical protein